MESGVWQDLRARWAREFGAFDAVAVCERLQPIRSGFALLLLTDGAPRAFLKIRQGTAPVLQREHGVISMVWNSRPRSFSVPEPLAFGSLGDWSYFGTAALTSRKHGVARRPPLAAIATEIGAALPDLPRPSGVPEHWEPMHGDLTPWNLRQLPEGKLVLFDWEDACWGPPGADEVFYRVNAGAIGRNEPGTYYSEAVRYWYTLVSSRAKSVKRDGVVDEALCRLLRDMHRVSGDTAELRVGGFPKNLRRTATETLTSLESPRSSGYGIGSVDPDH